MGNSESVEVPPPVTTHEAVRRDVIARLPVSYVAACRSAVSAAQRPASRRLRVRHAQTDKENGRRPLRRDKVADRSDYDEVEPSITCFAGRKIPPSNTSRTTSVAFEREYFDYGGDAFMWTRVPTPSPLSPASTETSCSGDLPNHPSPEPSGPATPLPPASNSATSARMPRGKRRPQHNTVNTRVIGARSNHLALLEPPVLDFFLPYLFGHSLPKVLAVCPHWFVSIYEHILRRASTALHNFQTATSQHLQLLEAGVALQKLPLKDGFPRIDIVIYAKVLPSCVSRSVSIGYSYSYATPNSAFSQPSRPPSFPPSDFSPLAEENNLAAANGIAASSNSSRPGVMDSDNFRAGLPAAQHHPPLGMLSDGSIMFPDRSSYSGCRGVRTSTSSGWWRHNHMPYVYNSSFRFVCQRKNTRRDIWMQRDITRFHGDEVLVGCLPSVSTVCAEDVLEIPIVLANAFGFTDLCSVKWHQSSIAPITPWTSGPGAGVDLCDLESRNFVWMDLDSYQQTTSERISDCDFFGPQWKHKGTEFTGIDITISRSKYSAVQTGGVSRSEGTLGIPFGVLECGKPIIAPLKRLGLQHDRITPQQMRVGDSMVLYMTQGGSVAETTSRNHHS